VRDTEAHIGRNTELDAHGCEPAGDDARREARVEAEQSGEHGSRPVRKEQQVNFPSRPTRLDPAHHFLVSEKLRGLPGREDRVSSQSYSHTPAPDSPTHLDPLEEK
jgi:hypothetical protein